MIEFKRAGDVMVFECPAFKVEVVADAEKIKFADTLHDPVERVAEAFKILDMMIEHKMRQTRDLKATEVDTKDVENAVDKLNRRYSGTCMRHYPENLEGI